MSNRADTRSKALEPVSDLRASFLLATPVGDCGSATGTYS